MRKGPQNTGLNSRAKHLINRKIRNTYQSDMRGLLLIKNALLRTRLLINKQNSQKQPNREEFVAEMVNFAYEKTLSL